MHRKDFCDPSLRCTSSFNIQHRFQDLLLRSIAFLPSAAGQAYFSVGTAGRDALWALLTECYVANLVVFVIRCLRPA